MRWWFLAVGILTLSGTLGCENDSPAPAVSERPLQVDEVVGSPLARKRNEQEENIAKWEARASRHREEAKDAWEQTHEDQKSRNLLHGNAEIPPLPDEYRSFIPKNFPPIDEIDEIIDRRRQQMPLPGELTSQETKPTEGGDDQHP